MTGKVRARASEAVQGIFQSIITSYNWEFTRHHVCNLSLVSGLSRCGEEIFLHQHANQSLVFNDGKVPLVFSSGSPCREKANQSQV